MARSSIKEPDTEKVIVEKEQATDNSIIDAENEQSTDDTTINVESTETIDTQMAYCGPAINGVAAQNAIFIGKLPAALEKAAEKCKAIKSLIVPINKFPKTLLAVTIPGTPENIFFRRAAEYVKGVK